jgi:hypothetical protein
MFKLKTHLKKHKTPYLIALVIALFATAIVIFTQLVDLKPYMNSFKGDMGATIINCGKGAGSKSAKCRKH